MVKFLENPDCVSEMSVSQLLVGCRAQRGYPVTARGRVRGDRKGRRARNKTGKMEYESMVSAEVKFTVAGSSRGGEERCGQGDTECSRRKVRLAQNPGS